MAIYRSKKSLAVFDKMVTWYNKPSTFFEPVEWKKATLQNVAQLTELMKGIDVVFHAAALVSFSRKDKYRLEEVNYLGTKQMVDLAIQCGVKEFYHVSSTAAIGEAKQKGEPATEKATWKKTGDQSNYALTKHLAELEVWRGMEEGLKVAIVNPGIIIGPGNWGKSSTSLFATVENGLRFYTKGVNGFVDVRDVAKALLTLYQKKVFGERYLLIGENTTYREVFNQIAETLNKPKPSFHANKLLAGIAWRVGLVWELITGRSFPITKETVVSGRAIKPYDASKIKEELNFEFTPIKEAIAHTAKCFRY